MIGVGKDTTINKIIEVTSIPNVGIESKDGEFDSAFEEFTITVDPLKFDNMEIEIQVKDKITNTIHSIPVELNITELEMTEDISNMSEPIVEPTPSGIASFVDQTKDPQHYIDRYNDELNYKEWFDEKYSQYNSIYQAVGLEEQIVEQINEPEYVTEPVFTPEPVMEQEVNCGTGTESVNGICQVLQTEEKSSKDGGCLIATATYGSEMATEVQQLRELRDNQLLQTASGTAFMGTFNDIYYLFSPMCS